MAEAIGRHHSRFGTDIRAVFKGAMIEHLGIDAAFVDARVFPESRSIRPLENLAVS